MDMDFGFPSEAGRFDAAGAFHEGAREDGWSVEPTYPQSEPLSRAATLTRDGFVTLILTRTGSDIGPTWRYQASMFQNKLWSFRDFSQAPNLSLRRRLEKVRLFP